ncbi:MAG: hypothetical protein R3F11_33345, partial [Verrucomicrobiales bacterium]
ATRVSPLQWQRRARAKPPPRGLETALLPSSACGTDLAQNDQRPSKTAGASPRRQECRLYNGTAALALNRRRTT